MLDISSWYWLSSVHASQFDSLLGHSIKVWGLNIRASKAPNISISCYFNYSLVYNKINSKYPYHLQGWLRSWDLLHVLDVQSRKRQIPSGYPSFSVINLVRPDKSTIFIFSLFFCTLWILCYWYSPCWKINNATNKQQKTDFIKEA